MKNKKNKFILGGVTAALVASAIIPTTVTNVEASESPGSQAPAEASVEKVKAADIAIGEVLQLGTERFVKYGVSVDRAGKRVSLFAQIQKNGENANSVETEQGLDSSSGHYLRKTNGSFVMYHPILQSGPHRESTTLQQKKETLELINEVYSKHTSKGSLLSIPQNLKNPLDPDDTMFYLTDYVYGNGIGKTLDFSQIGWATNATQALKDKYSPAMDLPVDVYEAAMAMYEAGTHTGFSSDTHTHIEIQDVTALLKNYELGYISEEDMPTYFGLDALMYMGSGTTTSISGQGLNVYNNYVLSNGKLTKAAQTNPTYTLKMPIYDDSEFIVDGTTESGKTKYTYVSPTDDPQELIKTSYIGFSSSQSSDTSKGVFTASSFLIGFDPSRHEITGYQVLETNTGKIIDVPVNANGTVGFTDGNITVVNSGDLHKTSTSLQAKRNGDYSISVLWKNKETGATGKALFGELERTGVSKLNTVTSNYSFEYDAGDEVVIPLDGAFGEDIYKYTYTPVAGQELSDVVVDAYKNEIRIKNKAAGNMTFTLNAKMLTSTTNTSKTFNVKFNPSSKNAPKLKGNIPDQIMNVGDPDIKINIKEYFESKNPESLTFNLSSVNDSIASAKVTAGTDEVTITPRTKGVVAVKGTATDTLGTSQEFQFLVDVREVVVVNNLPTVEGAITRKTVGIEEEFKLDVSSYFKDIDGDKLTYKVTTDKPSDADVGVVNGELFFIGYEPGNYSVSVVANDGKGNSEPLTFRIIVEEEEVVAPPTPPSATVTAAIPLYTEPGGSLNFDVKEYFKNADGATFSIQNETGSQYAESAITGSTLNIEGIKKGESLITVKATTAAGSATILVQAKVHDEVVTTPEIKPSAESGVSNVTIIGKEQVREIPLSTQFVKLDPATATFEVIGSDENLINVEFDEENQNLKVTSKEFGFGSVQVKGTDAQGNKANFLLLVDIKEKENFSLGAINNAVIRADEEAFIVPLNDVFGEVVKTDSNVKYTVGVNKKEEQQVASVGRRIMGAFASLGDALFPTAQADGGSQIDLALPVGTDRYTVYENGEIKAEIINNLLVVTGTEKSEYSFDVMATVNGVKAVAAFNLTVLKDPAEPTNPEPTNPEPTNPEPTNPEPTDPDPTNPEPTDPEPTNPEPTNPEPTNPEPTNPEPTDPEPTNPEPTDPEPTNPEPTDPDPTDPEPTNPEPTNPEPTNPEPTNPDGNGNNIDIDVNVDVENTSPGDTINNITNNNITNNNTTINVDVDVNVQYTPGGVEISLSEGNSDYLGESGEITIKEDGIYIMIDGVEVKIAENTFAKNLENKRAIRLTGNSTSSVMHYAENGALKITTKNHENILITSRVNEPFVDVDSSDWYYEDVLEAYNMVFTKGTTATTFEPNGEITRAQFAAMVARALEITEFKKYSNYSLSDLKGTWYADEVEMLVGLGIIQGYDNGEFGGNDKLTREQAMAILGRTLEYLETDTTSKSNSQLNDFNEISDYAKGYVSFFAENDVLVSGEEVSFNPKNNLTRGQMAKVLVRALQLTDKY